MTKNSHPLSLVVSKVHHYHYLFDFDSWHANNYLQAEMKTSFYRFLLFFTCVLSVQSFLTLLPMSALGRRAATATSAPHFSRLTAKTKSTTATTSLFNARYDGTAGRGKVLFGFVMFLCVWLFSIPPEFRRAYFCSPACEENPMYCNDCVTPKEWISGIVEYYQDGGKNVKSRSAASANNMVVFFFKLIGKP